MPRKSDARAKAIATAERLFCTSGYAATGLARILEESGAPKGSFYFHFPRGKAELAEEVIEAYRARTTALFRVLVERAKGDPRAFVTSLAQGIAGEMERSGWSMGCVAMALAQEVAPADAALTDALERVFAEWARIMAEGLRRPDEASTAAEVQTRALAFLAALEGARVIARTMRSREPFEAVVHQFHCSGFIPRV